MTVSHMFYDLKIVDASTNYEDFKKGKIDQVEYNINEAGFKQLMQCVALSTKATFSFLPSIESIKNFIAKKRRISLKKADDLKISEEDI